MKKSSQLYDFLLKKKKPEEYSRCHHSENEWCNNCVSHPHYVDLRDQGLGHGYFFTNKPKDL